MTWLYFVILAATFFATFAMMVQLGLWSNMITTINIVISGLVAFGYHQALGKLVVDNIETAGQYTFLLDFICLWLVYILTFILLQRGLTGFLSRTRMRFKHPIDVVGGPAVALLAGWIVASLVGSSLHIAPFDEDAFGGHFTQERSSVMTNPDLAWLQFTQTTLSPDRLGTSGKAFRSVDYRTDARKMRRALEKEESLKVRR